MIVNAHVALLTCKLHCFFWFAHCTTMQFLCGSAVCNDNCNI